MDPASLFEKFDKNGDGKLTREEMPERGHRLIDRFDADGDGALSKSELPSGGAGRGGRRGGGSGGGGPQGKFDQAAPKEGASLPPLTLFDAAGKPFDLRSQRKSYVVLVFGCLT